MAQLPLGEVLKRMGLANTFILFLWIFIPFSTPGDVIYRCCGLQITSQGIYEASLLTLKSNAAILTIIAFINTTPIPLLGHALSRLKLPSKFVLLFLLTYRYLTVIFEEFNRLMNAAKIRCFTPQTNLHTYKTISYLFAMILIRSYERGKRVYNAMLLRGFDGKFYCLSESRLRKNDLLLSLVTISLLIISLFIDHNLNYIYHHLKGTIWNQYFN